jgi:hypothetical protein
MGATAAAYTEGIHVQLYHGAAAGILVEIVDVLGNYRRDAVLLLEDRKGDVRGIRLCLKERLVEIRDKIGKFRGILTQQGG